MVLNSAMPAGRRGGVVVGLGTKRYLPKSQHRRRQNGWRFSVYSEMTYILHPFYWRGVVNYRPRHGMLCRSDWPGWDQGCGKWEGRGRQRGRVSGDHRRKQKSPRTPEGLHIWSKKKHDFLSLYRILIFLVGVGECPVKTNKILF